MGVSPAASYRVLLLPPLLTALCAAALGQTEAVAPSVIPYATPDTCSDTEIFQSGNLSCIRCEENSAPSTDGFTCKCSEGYVKSPGDSSSTPRCTSCPAEEVSSQDRLSCLPCFPPLSYNADTRTCSDCPSDQIFVDLPISNLSSSTFRTCHPCPPGTWPDSFKTRCVECGLANCTLCAQENTFGGLCFPSSPPLPSPLTTHTFTYYTQHFTAAVGECRHGNQTACQLVVNLCVLQRYSRSDPACIEAASSPSSLLPSPSSLLPSPFFLERGADEILSAADFSVTLSTTTKGTNTLPLLIASYKLDGQFMGLTAATNELLICRDLPPRYEAAWRVGVRYAVECSVRVASLSGDSPVFYDLYLLDRSGGAGVLHSVPVLPEDYVDGDGDAVNRGGVRGAWQFVTRLFLAEGISRSPRYTRSMQLNVELDRGGRVHIPYLRVRYAAWNPDSINSSIKSSFTVQYSQDITSFNIGMSVCVVVMATLVGVYTGFRVNGYLRRNGSVCCELWTYVFMVAQFSGGFSSLLFLLLTISSTVILILFKGQTVLLYTLPVGGQLLVFQLLLPLTLLLRFLHTVHLLAAQCSVDIFFIDWERPKMPLTTTNQNQEHPSLTPPPSSVRVPVSTWRTYFVANEWNELQTQRRGHPLLLLLLSLLLLQVMGLHHLAEHDPSGHVTLSDGRYSAPPSPLLRFSLTTLTLSSVAIGIRLFLVLVYERFIAHKIHQFVDLCSVSNISVLILSNRLHGYYIHGRSVHGQADTDMRQMSLNLQKEQEDMCGRRGLLPDSDLQTFQVGLTQQFRHHFDEILAPVMRERSESRGQSAGNGVREQRPHPLQDVGSEVTIATYERMNHFLLSFLEKSLRDLDYTSQSKLLVERILDTEFRAADQRSVFYDDPSPSFDRLLLFGQEWSLFQLELLVFATVDLVATDYVLSAIITALISWGVSLIRAALGQRNLKKKTLVDERFLI